MRCSKSSSGSTRRQLPRTAKNRFQACDYVLPGAEVNAFLHAQADDKTRGDISETNEPSVLTPSDDEAQDWDPQISVRHFHTRLSRAIQHKTRELKCRHDLEGIRHLCTVAGLDWNCVDAEYCGHGLVDRCLKWVPRKVEHLRPRMRVEMEGLFSAKTANNQPGRLKELKKYRCSMLKKATLDKLAALQVAVESHPESMMEAVMLESPTLGRWPATPGFLKEDIEAQTVRIAGLTFAVDVCLGEPRIMML